MTATYTFIPGLTADLPQPPPDSIISQTLFDNDELKAVLFAFAPGQELSEHTASMPAVLHLITGEAQFTLGPDHFTASPGAWAHMPANLPHSIVANTQVTLLLLLLKSAK